MLFDDRLATVLRSGAPGEAALRTQYRQLLDLLGAMPPDAEASELVEAALVRLQEIVDTLPAQVQSAIIRDPGLRMRNWSLIFCLAYAEPQVAAATVATAQLSESDWLYLIPRLPIIARGFLRHRRDLPESAKQVLERLGVSDLVLPQPDIVVAPVPAAEQPAPPPITPTARPPTTIATQREANSPVHAAWRNGQDIWIGDLVRRIEKFQRDRSVAADAATAPRLPLEETHNAGEELVNQSLDFETDGHGSIIWADARWAPMLVGVTLGLAATRTIAQLEPRALRAMERRLPLISAKLVLDAAAPVAGDWRVDAEPLFDEANGSFLGYRGRMRRPAIVPTATDDSGPADQLRQILHELKTPVNAIQGFAEIIQQQLFGPAPNEYRALAAAVSVDSAKLLAGFDEVDRLARLESGDWDMDEGGADIRAIIVRTLQRLEGALRPRDAGIDLAVSGHPFTIEIGEADAMRMVWRLLALLAGTLAAAEVIGLSLSSDEQTIILRAELPAVLKATDDITAAGASEQPRTISASTFGTGFAFRLARAEAIASGGTLERAGDELVLRLPVLTAQPAGHSVDEQEPDGTAAI